MGRPIFEVPQGAIDGVNCQFVLTYQYTPGTVAGYFNGLLHVRTYDDGWIETDPNNKIVTTKEAPLPGDIFQVFYLDRSEYIPEAQVFKLYGKVVEGTSIHGSIVSPDVFFGHVAGPNPLAGVLIDTEAVTAEVKPISSLVGRICVCNGE
jgi:hypothetical protein